MRITLKTLQHETIVMDVDGEQTVKVLKEMLEAEKGSENFPVVRQKLIYAGKVLEDDTQIGEYKIDEKNFVVVMVTKPARSAPPPSPPAPLSSSSSSRRRPPPPVPAPAAIPFTSGGNPPVPLQLDLGEEYDGSSAEETEEMVGRIVSMGYERKDAMAALTASHNDPDLAVEYLINGFPTVPVQETSPVTTHTPSMDSLNTEGGNPLEFLNSNLLFQSMRPQVQQDPSLLQSLLQDLTRESPDLLLQITQNQAHFLDMLNAQVGEEEREQHSNPGAVGGEEMTDVDAQITAQEKEAIERLKELGFPEAQVRQAYFVCQKNENLAANLLLAQASSEDD